MPYRSQIAQTLHYFARPHVGVPTRPIGGPAAWTASDLDPADWRVVLTESERDELRAAVRHGSASGRPLAAMSAADLPLPTLGPRIAAWRDEVGRGRGFVVIRGVPVEEWTEDEAARFFWGFGLHLGVPGAQNPQGDLLGHVRDEGFDHQTDVRAYRTRTRISFHCDTADVVGLCCLRQAARGGRSRIASSVAVFDALLRERPDLVPLLFEPFALDTKAEGGLRWFPIAPCRYDGAVLRTFYHADYFRSVTRHPDVAALDPRREALLAAYDAIADAQCVEMDLAPGDVQLVSNHGIVHGREAFEDGADGGRHLLRLWLSLPGHGARAWGPWLGLAGRLGWLQVAQRLGIARG